MLDSSSHLFYVIARGDAADVYRTKAEAKAKLALAGEMTRIGQFKNYEEARAYLLRTCTEPVVRMRYTFYEHPNATKFRALLSTLESRDILSIDTEFLSQPDTRFFALTQVSAVDTQYRAVYDEYFRFNKTSTNPTIAFRRLVEKERNRIAAALANAKVILGFQLGSDLVTLAQNRVPLPPHAVYIDLSNTYENYRRYKTLSMDTRAMRLKDVAEQMNLIPKGESPYFHNSLYDSLVAMRLFNRLQDDPCCQFYQIHDPVLYSPENDVSSSQAGPLPSPSDMERLDGTVQILENGIVQAFVRDETGTIIELRLTPREYRLYKLNRSYNPGYSLLTFYRTVALPKSIQKAEMLLKPKNLSPFCHIQEKEGLKSNN